MTGIISCDDRTDVSFFVVIWLSITFVAHMFPQVLQFSPKDYTMRISTEFMNLKGVHESQGSS